MPNCPTTFAGLCDHVDRLKQLTEQLRHESALREEYAFRLEESEEQWAAQLGALRESLATARRALGGEVVDIRGNGSPTFSGDSADSAAGLGNISVATAGFSRSMDENHNSIEHKRCMMRIQVARQQTESQTDCRATG